jgi:DNA-binding PadR family transcriptional regulator
MSDFDRDGFEAVFNNVILNAFRGGPLSAAELQVRVQTIRVYFDLMAARKRMRSAPDALLTRLERLRREGWLKVECEDLEATGLDVIYSLTTIGEERVEEERKRRELIVARFVENSELDRSFRQFLDRSGPFDFAQ